MRILLRSMTLASAAAGLAIAVSADAAVLCQKRRSGVVVAREACKPKETPLDLATFGAVGPPGTPGVPGAPGPSPSCPAGTALLEFACIELTQRAQETWIVALGTCRQASRRLPTLAELITFRFRADLNPPSVGSEWSDGFSGTGGTARAAYLTMNGGLIDTAAADSGTFNFRCVAPATL